MGIIKRRVAVTVIGLIVLGIGTTCKKDGIDSEANAEKEKVVMPKYSILSEDVYDIPLKTQVELNILVSGEISETGLKALLNNST